MVSILLSSTRITLSVEAMNYSKYTSSDSSGQHNYVERTYFTDKRPPPIAIWLLPPSEVIINSWENAEDNTL